MGEFSPRRYRVAVPFTVLWSRHVTYFGNDTALSSPTQYSANAQPTYHRFRQVGLLQFTFKITAKILSRELEARQESRKKKKSRDQSHYRPGGLFSFLSRFHRTREYPQL